MKQKRIPKCQGWTILRQMHVLTIVHCFGKRMRGKINVQKCGVSRQREGSIVKGGDSEVDNEGENMVTREPQLVLRHFPLIPRLLRMFVCSKLARHLRWHKDRHQEGDGILRHPSDGKAQKSLSELYPEFDADARSLRLGQPLIGSILEVI